VKPKNPEEEQRLYGSLAYRVDERVRSIEESDADPETKRFALREVYMRLIKRQREVGAREALGGRVLVGEAEVEEAFAALNREPDGPTGEG
jgi:hypothetical protein